jgi:hypothetical protein
MASERPFDELAKGLANNTISRRDALRWAGGALLGSVMASVPGMALAAPKPNKGGNRACAKFCAQTFGADTPEADRCTSEAAENRPGNLCSICNANAANVCGSGSSATCCGAGQACVNGMCVATCTFGGQCAGPNCGDGCFCRETTEGVPICVSNFGVGQFPSCDSTTECAAGSVCVQPCSGSGQCVPFPGQLCAA